MQNAAIISLRADPYLMGEVIKSRCHNFVYRFYKLEAQNLLIDLFIYYLLIGRSILGRFVNCIGYAASNDRMTSSYVLKYCLRNCLEGPRKLSIKSLCQDSNPGPPECEAGVLSAQPWRFVIVRLHVATRLSVW